MTIPLDAVTALLCRRMLATATEGDELPPDHDGTGTHLGAGEHRLAAAEPRVEHHLGVAASVGPQA